ncbi:hypothetical protein GNI_156960 [Gregarina niphandrodes]|uniref:Uncharacterized protein n=1 Tax=Gregarina niphandrodes TaxID=110365 RepID=A0A023AYX2_GRENI|nr:hypothetical protein GNI_156960 [Gregarina niphandrodes]EZG43856.1 hypothetical protein GNI_156960 [Gregarina niphandrodes]|eukprot:XP_011132944.1 hypothetical protein GNI_156960 [Gregarina niphandrodes]
MKLLNLTLQSTGWIVVTEAALEQLKAAKLLTTQAVRAKSQRAQVALFGATSAKIRLQSASFALTIIGIRV